MSPKILVIQPTVPTYRVDFFSALASDPNLDLQVQAAMDAQWGLPSGGTDRDWLVNTGRIRGFLKGRLIWQSGVKLPKAFGRGDVLVVAGNPRFLSNIPLILRARAKGGRVIWWGHGWSPTSLPWRAHLRYLVMRLCDVVLVYAEAEAEEVSRKGRFGGPIVGLNNSLHSGPMLAAQSLWTPERLSAWRREQGLDGVKLLFFCGRLRRGPSTELSVALRALKAAGAAGARYRLAIAGRGEEESVLRALAKDLEIEDRVIWIGEEYREEVLAPWFMSALCFIYPGPIGLSLIHSMIYGLPVVTHSDFRAHNPEIHALRAGYNGATFKRGDPLDCWRAISSICSDESRLEVMRRNARQTGTVDWSFEAMVKNFKRAVELAILQGATT